jgi:hypothetical protein
VSSRLLNQFPCKEDVYWGVAMSGAAVFIVLSALPFVWAQYSAAFLFGPVRSLLWSSYFHILYRPYRYPETHQGRMMGYGNLLIGLLGDIPSNYVCQAVTDPSIFPGGHQSALLYVNCVLGLLLLPLCVALPTYLRAQRRATEQVLAAGEGDMTKSERACE